jgi:hypothetical protein
MANIQEASFAVDAAQGTSFGFASTAVLLPGTPASDSIVRVANLGPCHISVKLGTSNAVTVTNSTGVVILAGQVLYLTLGANTYIAGVAAGGPGNASTVNLATGN